MATGNASFSPMLTGVAWMPAHELDRVALGGFSAARVIEMLCAARFAARFRETTGDSVMGCLGRWRANVACRLLCETDRPASRRDRAPRRL